MRRSTGVVAVLAALLLGGCGEDDPAPVPSTSTSTSASGGYVALGDSFASGTGTSGIYGERCQRSKRAYPWLLAVDRRLRGGFADQACAGATTTEVLAPQIRSLDGDTRLVTVTVGGNDVAALQLIALCLSESNAACRNRAGRVDTAVRTQLPDRLDAVFESIRIQAPDARTIVVGYPHLFAGRRCRDAAGATRADQRTINQVTDRLNAVLEERARVADATFADPRPAFAGHGVCSRDPWINAPSAGGGALHPTDDGHRLGMLPVLEAAIDG